MSRTHSPASQCAGAHKHLYSHRSLQKSHKKKKSCVYNSMDLFFFFFLFISLLLTITVLYQIIMTVSNLKHGDVMQQTAIEDMLQKFHVPDEKLSALMHGVGLEMKHGLKANEPSNDLKMIPSFVSGYPTGMEKGTYLALEISGVDVYVCQVRLKGEGGKLAINQYQYKIPDHLTAGDNMSTLIDYIADCVADFQHRVGASQELAVSMGISLGFAVRQTGLDKGFIVALEHGFEYPNAVGSDIVDLFHQRFEAKGLAVTVVAMANGKKLSAMHTKHMH